MPLFASLLLVAFVPTCASPTGSPIGTARIAQSDDPPPFQVEVARPEDRPLAIEMKLSKNTYTPLEPIVATIKVTNISQEVVYLDSYYNDYKVMDFEVVDTGYTIPKSVPRTYYHEKRLINGGHAVYDVKLKPGDSFNVKMVVNFVSDMTSPGHYSIVLALPYWKSHRREAKERKIVRSEAVKAEVKGSVHIEK